MLLLMLPVSGLSIDIIIGFYVIIVAASSPVAGGDIAVVFCLG